MVSMWSVVTVSLRITMLILSMPTTFKIPYLYKRSDQEGIYLSLIMYSSKNLAMNKMVT
jgi:hypothetical protein